jgi:hypothetical protein
MARRGFRPGSLGYEELVDIEHDVRRRLGLPMPDDTMKCIMGWRLDDMQLALATEDWDTFARQAKQLAYMLDKARSR